MRGVRNLNIHKLRKKPFLTNILVVASRKSNGFINRVFATLTFFTLGKYDNGTLPDREPS